MKNKKGFTLIELLAVIVILAVLALIVTPIVTGIINNSKNSADLRSAQSYVKAGEFFYSKSVIDSSSYSLLGNNVIDSLELSNDNATGSLIVNRNGSIEMAIIINNKCYKKSAIQSIEEIEISGIDDCNSIPTPTGSIMYDSILATYPYLEIGSDGCKTPGDNNYTYMGGCYLRGIISNNYVWYNGFLWRIMGLNSDRTVRMITEEELTRIPYDNDSSIFSGSYADDWLNNYFFEKINKPSIVVDGTWCNGDSEDYFVSQQGTAKRTTCSKIVSAKVGLLSLDEYNLSFDDAIPSKSYLPNDQNIVTLTQYNDSQVWTNYIPSFWDYTDVTIGSGIRPVINLNSSATFISGNGFLSDVWNNEHSPFIISDTSSNTILKDKAISGEYVKLADKIYRVVSTDSNGNTKLLLDGYYEETTGIPYTMTFGNDSTFTTSSGIGQKLNGDVLNYLIPSTDTTNRNKLVTNYTWYQNKFDTSYDYKKSLNESTPDASIKATVGLLRVGEMLSAQSYTIMTKNGTVSSNCDNAAPYWTMNILGPSNVWNIRSEGSANYDSVSSTRAIRPVIVVKSDTQITGGVGTPSSPYEI